jgi:hypothetical protein
MIDGRCLTQCARWKKKTKYLMKQCVAGVLALVLVFGLGGNWALAAPPDLNGGVSDGFKYEEMVFVSGIPVKVNGTYTLTSKTNKNIAIDTLKFTLNGTDAAGNEVKVARTVSYKTVYTIRGDRGQTIADTSVDKFSETITVGRDRFVLRNYELSRSAVIDNRPASDFYSGNISGRKYYTVNTNRGSVTIDVSGGDIGYSNFWGKTDTQVLDYTVSGSWTAAASGTNPATAYIVGGSVRVQVADSLGKVLRYSSNDANFTSFDGGYVRVSNRELVSSYQYDMQRSANGASRYYRNAQDVAMQMVPKVERLVLPKFKDISGHWAEQSIRKLYSLDVYNDAENFFSPDTRMTRSEFIRALMRACDIRVTFLGYNSAFIDEKAKSAAEILNEREEPEFPFIDIDEEDPNYDYIYDAFLRGVVGGRSGDLFYPDRAVTRAEALSFIVRAVGMQTMAPSPGYRTHYTDDASIPYWALDNIFAASQMGLVKGDAANMIYPNKNLTRAEASDLLVSFLVFLQNDLQKDYREHIIQY